ncbi:MAG TPA: serine hydrolase domain-containing protein, partial [Kofleriaceae bacterium]|nr:serine hydrolase domain-containing protein [Kofleriaceae bacterium]
MKALAIAAVLCSTPVLADPPKPDARFEKILIERSAKLHIPGIAYAIIKDDKVIAIGAIGVRDTDKKLPVTDDTVFPIGSCTKSFTAMAVAIAADDSKLSVDDSPHKLLPYFKMADPEANDLVTLRDMLSHRTGVMPYGDLAAEPDVLGRDDYIRAAVGAKPVAKLRAGYQYSNAMVTAAGEAVARAYAMSWDKVIETKIFSPLGMSASVTHSDKLASLPDGAIGYTWDGVGWKAAPPATSLRVLAPAGAIASSASDMAKWVRALANGGELDGKRLVSEAMFAELGKAHTQINDTLAYGLGWALYDWNGHHVMEHNGGSVGLSALVSVIPERHAGFVVLANTSPTELTKIGSLGAQLWPVILGERATKPPP